MLKLLKRIDGVEYFTLSQAEILYKIKNGEIYLNNNILKGCSSYGWLPYEYIQYKKYEEIFIINKSQNISFTLPHFLLSNGFSPRGGYFTANFNYDAERELTFFDFLYYDFQRRETNIILHKTALIPSLFIEGRDVVIMYLPKTVLKLFSLLTSEYQWETNLSSHGEIRQILGIYENQLLVTLTSNELISINIENGEILWETQDLQKKYLSFQPFYKHRGCVGYGACHLEKGKLYELTASLYYSIDLNTQTVEILWEDERENGYITVNHRTYTEDYIYFTGSYNNAFQPHLLGVFNRKTLTVDWLEDVSLEIDPKLGYVASLNQAPQVGDNKLYVLDSGGTLHIYEKE